MPPPVSHGSDSESNNDSDDSRASDEDEILIPLAEDDVGVSDGGGEESGAEAGDLIGALGPGDELPPDAVVAPALAAPAVPADPVADPMLAEAPAWALGVESAEVCRNANTKCIFCGDKIPRNVVRFKYWTHKSVFRFMHSTCFGEVPLAHRAHSIAALRYQREVLVSPDSLYTDAAIDAVFAM